MLERARCASCGAKTQHGRVLCPRCSSQRIASGPPARPAKPPKAISRRVPRLALGGAALSLILFLVLVMGRPRTELTDTGRPASLPEATAPAKTASVSAPRIAAQADPVTSFDFDRAGAVAYSEGRFAAALERFEQAVKKNPDDPRALNNLGQALVRVERAREALPHFARATELIPSEWAPRFNLAHAYGALGQWNEAIPEYQKAAELFPDDYVTQYNLGLAFHKAGREEPAVAAFQRAIALAPGEPSFHLSLGISYEVLNQRVKAAEAYEAYLEMSPSAPDAETIRSRISTLRTPA